MCSVAAIRTQIGDNRKPEIYLVWVSLFPPSPGGKLVDHPRAANFVRRLDEGPYRGRYLYWFHNNKTPGWDGRNPAYLLGGVEVDGPNGKHIQWGEPLAVLYDRNPQTRISYPDFLWDNGLYITETQKVTARVHRIPDELLQRLWEKGRPKGNESTK